MGIGTTSYRRRTPQWLSDWNYTRSPWHSYVLSAIVMIVTAPIWIILWGAWLGSVAVVVGTIPYLPVTILLHLFS